MIPVFLRSPWQSLYSLSTWAAFPLSPLAQPFLPRRRRRLLPLLLVGRRRRPCRPCSRCQTPLPAARSHKDKCAEKSYPAAAAAAQKAAGAGELLYEVLAGGRAGRGRVTGDGRTNAGCVASCEKKGSEQAGEGTNERTNERTTTKETTKIIAAAAAAESAPRIERKD